MSHSRKHLTTNVLTSLPLPTENERIVRVSELRGANICEVELPEGDKILVQIPTRFRKLVWIKKGNFLIINRPNNWDNLEYKVKAMVQHVLFPDQIKNIKKEGLWPMPFEESPRPELANKKNIGKEYPRRSNRDAGDESPDEPADEDDLLFANPNHRAAFEESDSEEEDSDQEDSD
eukprot:TRINITY_DN1601_c0_g1_i1.p1 TRINITY_DN1601_c0_g1~~TRINITY_DN1601_c0_g1_i1.p1  ORF type:complete len:176 (-),score=31.18 TRINITY_DN1601_c0_g1_i1:71-598(-)